MSNMSYCRFENTASDLHDCVDALESGDLPDSTDELKAADRMAKLCKRYLAAYNENRDDLTQLMRDTETLDEDDDDA